MVSGMVRCGRWGLVYEGWVAVRLGGVDDGMVRQEWCGQVRFGLVGIGMAG